MYGRPSGRAAELLKMKADINRGFGLESAEYQAWQQQM
jgi:hypothetical protein